MKENYKNDNDIRRYIVHIVCSEKVYKVFSHKSKITKCSISKEFYDFIKNKFNDRSLYKALKLNVSDKGSSCSLQTYISIEEYNNLIKIADMYKCPLNYAVKLVANYYFN